MKEFIIKVDINKGNYEYETFTWRTKVDNWEQAAARAVSFADMALKEGQGVYIDSIIIREVEA